MIENADVQDLQHELSVMIKECIADIFGDDADEVDEGSIASELFASMTYEDYDADLLAEVARREFGYVPHDARADVHMAFEDLFGEFEW